MPRITPSSSFFVGRNETCQTLIDLTRRTNAVLLFGGRQAGKTTLLLQTRKLLSQRIAHANKLDSIEIPIYIDLNTLKYDAEPPDFFNLLLEKATESCQLQILGTNLTPPRATPNINLDSFISGILALKAQCGEVEPRFIFLLDESKRVLGDRFPRGFQDNLFSLLYGEKSGVDYHISMVFSGAQHLYVFSQDDTSPIGSRAATLNLTNLTQSEILELINLLAPSLLEHTAKELSFETHQLSGGHAGLTARSLEEFLQHPWAEKEQNQAKDLIFRHHRGLLENWISSLTPETKEFSKIFAKNTSADIQSIAKSLKLLNFDAYLAHRVSEELQYMGLAIYSNQTLLRVNIFFWSYFENITPQQPESEIEQQVWPLIEKTELALRDLIKIKYRSAYSEKHEDLMKEILGQEAWHSITTMATKSEGRYKYSNSEQRDIMSCMYFGHLKDLIISKKAWHLFKDMFRDKRELEDEISAIIPVRNDKAHFTTTPDKELARCKISCDDLLTIAERELMRMGV